MRKIAILPKAKIAPAMPPPTATFAMLICGVRVSSLIAAGSGSDLITGLRFQKFTRSFRACFGGTRKLCTEKSRKGTRVKTWLNGGKGGLSC